jgi:WD40 repeat protein
VRLWDAATGQPRITFTGHSDAIGGLVITPDGQTVLSAGFDRTIQAWDLATGVVRYVLRGHSDRIHDLAQSPDGRALASASRDKTCILWDIPGRPAPRDTSGTHRRG